MSITHSYLLAARLCPRAVPGVLATQIFAASIQPDATRVLQEAPFFLSAYQAVRVVRHAASERASLDVVAALLAILTPGVRIDATPDVMGLYALLQRGRVLDKRRQAAAAVLAIWTLDPALVLELVCPQRPNNSLRRAFEREVWEVKRGRLF